MPDSSRQAQVLETAAAHFEDLLFQHSILLRISTIAQDEVAVEPMGRRLLALLSHVLNAPDCALLARDVERHYLVLGPSESSHWGTILEHAWQNLLAGRPAQARLDEALLVPVRRGERLLGAIGIRLPLSYEEDPRQQAIVTLFADQLGPLIERAFAMARVEDHYIARLEFVRDLIHDMRNPLTGALSTLASLASPKLEFEPMTAKRLIRSAWQSALRLSGMLDDLLDFYRSEAGQMEWYCEPIDSFAAVVEALEAARSLSNSKGIALYADVPP
ncbi:MAG: hypothetical protein KGR26_10975, partial [Cyanobacteria bacterium REEB65]|nr:hypothetical protein [Cyanobacteria bacterium REEB65]